MFDLHDKYCTRIKELDKEIKYLAEILINRKISDKNYVEERLKFLKNERLRLATFIRNIE